MIAYVDTPVQLLQVYEYDKQRIGLDKIYILLNCKVENDKRHSSKI